jgi:hypothetical protein
MKRNKPWMDEEHYVENFFEEMLYRQALEWEWEEHMKREMMKEKGRIHTTLKQENLQDESNSEFITLPF